MIIQSIRIKEGLFERTINFSDGVNLIFSEENSKGKTTLLRFMLYSLGYNIPNTKNIKFDQCEVISRILVDNIGEITLSRFSYDFIEATISNEKKTFILPDQMHDLHKIIFGTKNTDVLNNILGAIYTDQEKGWTLLNRGTVIGSIRFNIEELIRGLSDCDCSDLIRKEIQLSKELSKYRQMFSVAKYRDKIIEESGTLVSDSYSEESDAVIAQLLIQQKALQSELRRIDKSISDNKRVRQYVAEMKLIIQLPDGTEFPVTSESIVGLSDTIDFLITKRKITSSELKSVMHQLEDKQKEQTNETEQLAFFQSESMIDIFDRRVSSIPINASVINKEVKRLEKTLRSIRQEISSKTKSNTGVVNSLYQNMVKYASELGVGNSDSIVQSYLFTSNLKELSGAVLHKTVFAFRLAYIIEIEKYLHIKLPIILDSPSGKEVDRNNIQLMMNILKRDFSGNQIIIASIFKYDFDSPNVIELRNRLIES
ncbi:hypothetical protein [Fastidiosipila sanguinis]|uniref:Rad50/SbcC-type AAA domain-containing protein n=1 Tax=Fastidiosipila sanguinis TaxID=236753 RepID=A0A2S0KP16_9FIRM|nr:hypothetical protein [Fastidiosipila sanguinis]AVM42775.1 hypothetical protein C5Q98_05915 [Fastidiosipila sanguinis]